MTNWRLFPSLTGRFITISFFFTGVLWHILDLSCLTVTLFLWALTFTTNRLSVTAIKGRNHQVKARPAIMSSSFIIHQISPRVTAMWLAFLSAGRLVITFFGFFSTISPSQRSGQKGFGEAFQQVNDQEMIES